MRIAILIGISEYSKPFSGLPACNKETITMGNLLEATGQYEDILVITNNTTSAKLKSKISSWIESHQKSKLDEVFFYYTGHLM